MTYRKVEGGEPVTDTTYGKVEVGFGMRPGSCRAVLDGADSIFLEDGTELIEGGQITHFDPRRLEDGLRQAFTRSAGLTVPGLTLGEVEAMHRELVRELQEQGILPKGD